MQFLPKFLFMKHLFLFSLITIVSIGGFAQVNNNQYKPGTTVLNSNSNNSNSGVNPNGNPGTILYNNSNSNAVNGGLIQPNTAITTTVITHPVSSPIVTRETEKPVSGDNGNNKVVTSTAVNPNEQVVTTVETVEIQGTAEIKNNLNPAVVKLVGSTSTGLNTINNAPVLSSYIPTEIITRLKSVYGNKLYDITMMKKSDSKFLYIIRVKENGAYITHYLDEKGFEIQR